jgi:peptidoglycan-associated lipoprotein
MIEPIRHRRVSGGLVVIAMAVMLEGACRRDKPPVAKLPPPPPAAKTDSGTATPARPPEPPKPVPEPVVPVEPANVTSASLDDLNKNSPLKPVFFEYDSSEISPDGQAALQENLATLKQNPSWSVTIEGHCDERGSAEYNLALGERRAVTVRAYLVSLGVPADRLRTVSYGKEFPFDLGHDEAAMAKNRRAHFVITAK